MAARHEGLNRQVAHTFWREVCDQDMRVLRDSRPLRSSIATPGEVSSHVAPRAAKEPHAFNLATIILQVRAPWEPLADLLLALLC